MNWFRPQFDVFLKSFVFADIVERVVTVRLVCCGQLPLRHWFHQEVASKGIQVPDYYYSFFDLVKEFAKFIVKDKAGGSGSAQFWPLGI